MKVRNILLAFLLSMTLTFGLAFVYVFYPMIFAVLRRMLRSPGIGGIDAVAGGVSSSFLIALMVLELFIFLIIFGLLQGKHARR